MQMRWVRNGVLVDSGETPSQETTDTPAQGPDGRTLVPYVQSVYRQDGSVVRTTDRVDIGGRPLPASGNVTRVMPVKTG